MDNNKSHQAYEVVGEHVSIFQRGSRWYAHYRFDGKPVRQSLKTSSKKEARRKALGIERDLLNGEVRRPMRAPLITETMDKYLAHLRAQQRSKNMIDKYQFCFRLVLDLAAKRKISRIDQIDLAFVDAYKAERTTHRVKPKKKDNDAKSETQDNSQ